MFATDWADGSKVSCNSIYIFCQFSDGIKCLTQSRDSLQELLRNNMLILKLLT